MINIGSCIWAFDWPWGRWPWTRWRTQGLIFRAYRHGRDWRSEIRAWKFGSPCL